MIFINNILNSTTKNDTAEELVIRTIAVFPITNQSDNKEYNYLTYTIRDALKAQLIQTDQFLFSDFTELDKELKTINFTNKTIIDEKTAKKIALKTKAHIAIIGRFIIDSDKIMIWIDAVDITLNKTAASTSIKGDLGLDIFRIVDKAAVSMSEKMTKKIIRQGPFTENFDSVDLGEIPKGWSIDNKLNEKSEIGTVSTLEAQPVTAPNCLKIYDGGRTEGAVITIYIHENNYGQLKFNMKLASSVNLSRLGIVLKDISKKKEIINLSMDEFYNISILNPDRTRINLINFTNNIWYSCQINWDLTTGYYKILINDIDYGIYRLMNQEVISRIQFYSGSTPDSSYFNSTAYIDNVEYSADTVLINKP